MTEEIRNTISACYCHLRNVEMMLEMGQPTKADGRALELVEQAKLLRNALFRAMRNSGEVRKS